MSEQDRDAIYDQHVKRLEKNVKVIAVIAVALISYIVWFMMHQ